MGKKYLKHIGRVIKMKAGKVYLIGAGPGDYRLMTLKGLDIIQGADVILYDRLVNNKLLKYAREIGRAHV